MTHLPRLTGFYKTGSPRNSLAATFPPIFTAFYFPNSTFCALKTGAINFIPLKSNAAHKDRPVNGSNLWNFTRFQRLISSLLTA